MRTQPTKSIVLLIAATVALSGAEAPADDRGLAGLRLEVAELRRELAVARLELSRAIAELEELRDYLAMRDAEAQIERLRAEREELAVERLDLAERRAELEERQAAVRADLHEPPPPDPNRPRWELDYRIAAVPRDAAAPVFIRPVVGPALLRRFPDADRRQVLVRGTIQNRSAAPWRYTFEVRIANRSGQVIGRWRHQTPRLDPDDLHEFEVKVPVTDVARAHTYQIGNIEADDGPADDAPDRG